MRTSRRQSSALFKKSKVQLFNFARKLELPAGMGSIIKLSDDIKKTESASHYKERCTQEIYRLIKTQPEMVSILVTGAVLGVKQNSVTAANNLIAATRERLFKGQPLTAEMRENSHWGHISLYHLHDGVVISHSGIPPQDPISFDAYLKRDVKIAVDESGDARYFAQLSSSLFPKNKHPQLKKEDYKLMGNNCAMAVKKWVGLTITAEGNNPLQAFHHLLTDIVLSKIDLSLQDKIAKEILHFGIDRTVTEVSKEAAEHREALQREELLQLRGKNI